MMLLSRRVSNNNKNNNIYLYFQNLYTRYLPPPNIKDLAEAEKGAHKKKEKKEVKSSLKVLHYQSEEPA